MAKKQLNKFFYRYFSIAIMVIGVSFGLTLGFVLRKSQVEKSTLSIENRILNSTVQIQNQVKSDYSKVTILSEIVSSQINTPRAFYDFNSLFKGVLSAESTIHSTFVILSPDAVDLDESLYPLLDTLNRYDVVWEKNAGNIVYLDSLENKENNYYFETVKNSGKPQVFNSGYSSNSVGSKFIKTFAFPIFEGTHFIGVIGFSISLDFLNAVLIQEELNDKTFVIDEDGIILYDRGKLSEIGNPYTAITNHNFSEKQVDILQNIDFIEKNNKQVLFFRTFKPDPFGVDWKIGVLVASKDIYAKANRIFFFVLLISVFIAFFILFIFRDVLNKINGVVKILKLNVENLYYGKISEKIKIVDNFAEIKSITENLEKLRLRLVKLSDIYLKIQEQSFDERIKELGSDDILASSINITIDKILERSKVRENALQVKERSDWITEGLNIIHEASRIDEDSIEILTDRINKKISAYSDAFLTTFFISSTDEESGQEYLSAISTFGLDKSRAYNKTIKLGEGVVGSVAIERKKQYFEKIPDDYHIIVSGLSEMKPISILVQPLEYEGEFYGILEIAFLKKLEVFELDFFESASKEIALSFKNIINNISTKKLIEKMKFQTNEIEETQKMLQSKIKEVTLKEKEAHEREVALKGTVMAVNNTLMTIEYTTSGILLNANQKYLDAMSFSIQELKGVNVLDLVKTERSELEQVIKRVAKGEYYEKVMKRFTKYGEVRWLHSTYTPYYGTDGSVTKILYFAFDVTKTKENSEKIEKDARMLRKQIKLLRQKL